MVSDTGFRDSGLPGSCCHDDGVGKRVERIETSSPPLVLRTTPSKRRSTGRHSSAPRPDGARHGCRPVGFVSGVLPRCYDTSQARSSPPTSGRKYRVAWGGRSPGDLEPVGKSITYRG